MKKIITACIALACTLLPIKSKYCEVCNHHHVNGICTHEKCDCDINYAITPFGKDYFPDD